MQFNNPAKHFPELAGMPQNIQEEITERAHFYTADRHEHTQLCSTRLKWSAEQSRS